MIRDEFLDKCLDALVKVVEQGRPSINDDTACVYRGLDGARCAVGWMIPDEQYVPEMEGKPVMVSRYDDRDFITCQIVEAAGAINNAEVQLLSDLQDAHDMYDREDDALTFMGKVVTKFRKAIKLSMKDVFTTEQHAKVNDVLGKLEAEHCECLNTCS